MNIKDRDPRRPNVRAPAVQAISDPTEDNIVTVLAQLKEAVETIAGLRGEMRNRSASLADLESLGIITILDNGHIQSNLPFDTNTENSLGVLKYCDGETEDFGSGEGWYTKKSTGWTFIA